MGYVYHPLTQLACPYGFAVGPAQPYPLLRMYHRGYTLFLAIIFFTVQRQDILASSAIV